MITYNAVMSTTEEVHTRGDRIIVCDQWRSQGLPGWATRKTKMRKKMKKINLDEK